MRSASVDHITDGPNIQIPILSSAPASSDRSFRHGIPGHTRFATTALGMEAIACSARRHHLTRDERIVVANGRRRSLHADARSLDSCVQVGMMYCAGAMLQVKEP